MAAKRRANQQVNFNYHVIPSSSYDAWQIPQSSGAGIGIAKCQRENGIIERLAAKYNSEIWPNCMIAAVNAGVLMIKKNTVPESGRMMYLLLSEAGGYYRRSKIAEGTPSELFDALIRTNKTNYKYDAVRIIKQCSALASSVAPLC